VVLTTNLLSCESTSWGANATIKRAIIQIIGGSDFANKGQWWRSTKLTLVGVANGQVTSRAEKSPGRVVLVNKSLSGFDSRPIHII